MKTYLKSFMISVLIKKHIYAGKLFNKLMKVTFKQIILTIKYFFYRIYWLDFKGKM